MRTSANAIDNAIPAFYDTDMRRILLLLAAAGLFFFASASPVGATHSWGGYHWARTINPFTLKLGDNLMTGWKQFLGLASSDWSLSNILDTSIVPGSAKGNCRATTGRVEVCNKAYGNNGWLGLAQIWVSGQHITAGTVKVNDTYFATASYNTPAWRQFVMCQEVGHTLGLDHQDTDFSNANVGSCMDYTSDPDGTILRQLSNLDPNKHDYDELGLIYAHFDAFTSLGATKGQIAQQTAADAPDNLEDRSSWGKLVKQEGKIAVYERDFGAGNKVYTFVILAT